MLQENGGLVEALTGVLAPSVKVHVLALALIDVCENGAKKKVIENDEVANIGNEALKRRS